jgi:hypothetical protein
LTLPDLVEPVLTAGGPLALAVILLRFAPDAVVRLLAGTVAVLTGDPERRKTCLTVLRILRGRDDDDDSPPSLPDSTQAGP